MTPTEIQETARRLSLELEMVFKESEAVYARWQKVIDKGLQNDPKRLTSYTKRSLRIERKFITPHREMEAFTAQLKILDP
jgi:hypothetical protein